MLMQQPEPHDFVEVGGQWYVRARSALADDRTRVLKEGETFAVFDRYGDIQPIGLGEQGLYHEGTRHLSHLDLRIAHKRPLLLSSGVSADNSLLSVDLTNPEFEMEDGSAVPAETLYILRTLFLWQGTCHQRLEVHNYGSREARFSLGVRFEADFRDIFEVRGIRREQRGRIHPLERRANRIVLAYDGLDAVRRETVIASSQHPSARAGSSVSFDIVLQAGGVHTAWLRVECLSSTGPVTALPAHDSAARAPRPSRYLPALRELQDERARELDEECSVQSSSEDLNAWLNRSQMDLLMLETRSESGPFPYAGIPWFSTPFGRDAIIAALQMLWVRPSLAAGVLRYLAATQAREFDQARDAAPGKILHESRLGEMASLGEVPFQRYYGSVDATPLFVVLAGAHFESTGDIALLDEIWPAIAAALQWILEYGDTNGDGLIDYQPNAVALRNQGWKDSGDSVFHADGTDAPGPIALCEVQAYAFAALRAGAQLAAALGHLDEAERCEVAAHQLRRVFEERFWLDELGIYALAIDGDGRACAVRTSNAGHALFGQIATAEHATRVSRTLMSPPLFSGWGIRTLAAGEPRFNPMSYHNGSVWPHDNAMIADGMSRYGLRTEVLRLFDAVFSASRVLDLQRLPELYCGFPRRSEAGPTSYPLANAPQAWAAGSVFMLLRACLGLTIDGLGKRIVLDHPVLPPSIDRLRLTRLRVGDAEIDLELHRYPAGVASVVTRRTGNVSVVSLK